MLLRRNSCRASQRKRNQRKENNRVDNREDAVANFHLSNSSFSSRFSRRQPKAIFSRVTIVREFFARLRGDARRGRQSEANGFRFRSMFYLSPRERAAKIGNRSGATYRVRSSKLRVERFAISKRNHYRKRSRSSR